MALTYCNTPDIIFTVTFNITVLGDSVMDAFKFLDEYGEPLDESDLDLTNGENRCTFYTHSWIVNFIYDITNVVK